MALNNRAVRIFISSTFRDMHAEREELVKFIFPELRRRCRERGVEFLDVDLRWGVTDEQKAEGKVLPICLAEIERCRPYFIGLLGERYGWVPDEIDQELIDDQPWLEQHREKSVTDLEIQHGVLENPNMDGIAFFYFRDPETSKQVEAELAREPDYQVEPEIARSKLEHLKKRIKDSEAPLRECYPDAKTLGQWILEALWAAIDRRFPEDQTPTTLERTRMDHEAFAAVRRKVYLGRPEYFEAIDRYVADEGPPLVLLGESGSGKSALIANWAEHYRKQNPDDFLLLHFIGSTADSADYVSLLRRIMQEIQERYEPREQGEANGVLRDAFSNQTGSEDIPSDPQKVIEAFPLWLAKVAAKGRFILVLDALNQLEDRNNAPDLGWLPTFFPANVRVILSTLPGRCLEALQKRESDTLPIEPINKAERKQFIHDYLKQYRKGLDQCYADRIAAAPQSANPLYLRTLLEELRVFGKHEALEKRITHYLEAETVDDLFERVLERLEEDYEQQPEHQGLVKKVMTLLWASRRGLSEREVLELIDLPPAIWSPLRLALDENLVDRSGLLNFFHDFLRKAVDDRYLDNQELQRVAHLALADYFDGKVLDDRKIDELPWQLWRAEHWDRLKNCVTDLELFLKLNTEVKKYELIGYWMAMEDRFDMVEEYEASLNKFETSIFSEEVIQPYLEDIASFLRLNAKYDGAERLYRRSLGICEKNQGVSNLEISNTQNALAELLRDKGDYEDAELLYRKALPILENALGVDHPETAVLLNNFALLLQAKGDYKEAEPLLRKVVKIWQKALGPEHPDTATIINNLAVLLYIKGDYSEAEPLYRKALMIREKVLGYTNPYTAQSLNNLAELLRAQNDYSGAEVIHRQALAINKKIFGDQHPTTAISFNNLAELLFDKGKLEEAEPLYRIALSINENTLGAEHTITAQSQHNLAKVLKRKGDYEGAGELFLKAFVVSENKLGVEHPITADFLFSLVGIIRNRKDDVKAEEYLRSVLRVLEDTLGVEHSYTIRCLVSLASMLQTKGDYDAAELLYRRALEIREVVLGERHQDTAAVAFWLGDLLYNKGDGAGAVPFYRRALDIYGELYNQSHMADSELSFTMAICHNQVAYHGDVPIKNWKQAESHYHKAIELFVKADQPIEAVNAELNLQAMYYLSGQSVDLDRVSEITRLLDEAGDQRTEKGKKLLEEINP